MTQKELLYVEDAIKHEQNVIAYLNDMTNILEDENLVSFIEDEIKKHQGIEKKFVKALEDKANE